MINIVNEIKNQDNIVVFVHENPDGDAIGSIISLSTALRLMGKNVEAYVEFYPSNNLFLIEKAPWVKTFDELDTSKVYNLAIALDCGDKMRMGKANEVFDKALSTINIDHHITNDNYGKYNFVDAKAAATGEIMYDLIKMLDIGLTTEIAEAIYLAIVSDTGTFKHSNTTPKTLETAARLLETGIDISYLIRKAFYETSLERTRCLGKVLSSLEVELDGKVGILHITPEELDNYNVDSQDLEGMVDFSRNIKGAEVGIFIKPRNGEYKISLRSNNYVDVAAIAGEFGGGGHVRAAGCSFSDMTIEEIKEKLLEKIKEQI